MVFSPPFPAGRMAAVSFDGAVTGCGGPYVKAARRACVPLLIAYARRGAPATKRVEYFPSVIKNASVSPSEERGNKDTKKG